MKPAIAYGISQRESFDKLPMNLATLEKHQNSMNQLRSDRENAKRPNFNLETLDVPTPFKVKGLGKMYPKIDETKSLTQDSAGRTIDRKREKERKDYAKDPPKYQIVDEETYEIKLKYCEIRQNKLEAKAARAETPWTYEAGVFKDYLKEKNKALINKCFEQDWGDKKAVKFKVSSEEEIKEEMKKVYPLLKDIYRSLAGQDPTGNIMSIGLNTINIFMTETLDCLDVEKTGKLKPSDADRMMITVNAGRQGPQNPA